MTESRRELARWLLPASALHLAVLWLVSTQRAPQTAPPVVVTSARELEVELDAAELRAPQSGSASVVAAPIASIAPRANAGSRRLAARVPAPVAPSAAESALESPSLAESAAR